MPASRRPLRLLAPALLVAVLAVVSFPRTATADETLVFSPVKKSGTLWTFHVASVPADRLLSGHVVVRRYRRDLALDMLRSSIAQGRLYIRVPRAVLLAERAERARRTARKTRHAARRRPTRGMKRRARHASLRARRATRSAGRAARAAKRKRKAARAPRTRGTRRRDALVITVSDLSTTTTTEPAQTNQPGSDTAVDGSGTDSGWVVESPSSGPAPATPSGPFSALNRPPGDWRPFSAASPFNNPVPANPSVLSNSAQMVAFLRQFGSDGPDSLTSHDGSETARRNDYTHPVYFSGSSDPLYQVNCTDYGGACPVDEMSLRIPTAAQSAAGTDGHLHVWDQENGFAWDFYRVQTQPLPPAGGRIDVGWARRTPIAGTGTDGGGSAAQFSGFLGKIRWQEFQRAIEQRSWVNHALFMVVKCSQPGYVYPATKGEDKNNCSGYDRTHAPRMGQYFWLDMSIAEIDALAIPEWRKVILRTLNKYGAFVGDQGGGRGFGFQFESSLNYTAYGQASPFNEYAARNPSGIWDDSSGSGLLYWNLRSGVDWFGRLRALDPGAAYGAP